MRATRKGIWIIGIIIIVLGIIDLLLALREEKTNQMLLIVAILFLVVGFAMTIAGVVTTIGASRDNKQYLQEYKGKIFVTTCFNCGQEVECYAEEFSEHRNYPEGFIYCPVCRKPLSMYAFDIYDDYDE